MTIRDWAHLPQELQEIIHTHLHTHFDYLQFRSICHTWRSALPPYIPVSPKLPYLPNSQRQQASLANCTFPLVEYTVYAIQPSRRSSSQSSSSSSTSCNGWIVKLKGGGTDGLQFLSPLSGSQVKFAPKAFLNTVDIRFKVTLLCKEYHLDGTEFESVLPKERPPHSTWLFDGTVFKKLDCFSNERFNIRKLVLSPKATNDDFVVMAIRTRGNLILLRSGDRYWSLIEELDFVCCDLVLYKGKFYVVSNTGAAYSIDPHTTNVTEVAANLATAVTYITLDDKKHLVESMGELFLVNIYDGSCYLRWTVFKLDEDGHEWVQIHSLGDRIFFLGIQCSFSVSKLDILPGCKGNCILFTDSSVKRDANGLLKYGNAANQGIGVFDMEDGSSERLEEYASYSQLFWPPPTWITCSNSH